MTFFRLIFFFYIKLKLETGYYQRKMVRFKLVNLTFNYSGLIFYFSLFFCIESPKIDFACVLFTLEKKYSVIKFSLNCNDKKKGFFITQSNKDYQVVVLCNGTQAACIKRSKELEKALATDLSSESECSTDEEEVEEDDELSIKIKEANKLDKS